MTDTITNLCTDVLVVGGGMAACTAAIAARKPPVEVLIIDKGRIGFSGTSPRCGGGGTGWVLLPPEFGGDPRDSHDVMLADCVKGGEYLNVQEHTEILNVESLERLLETEVLGVHYHRTPEGKYPIARTMAFSYPRPPSSNAIGGSQVVMKTIREAVLSRRISTLEHVMVTRLFLENNRIAGDFGINVRTGDLYSISAGAVILASGSATGLYKYPTCVNELTGDSYALAFEAGASLMNMEFLQFSITGMIDGVHVRDIGGIKPMIANGVRWVNARGEAFMSRYDPARAEFTDWWRNIYAISKENQEGRGPVYLDMSKVAERVKDLWEDNTTQAIRGHATSRSQPSPRPVGLDTGPSYFPGRHDHQQQRGIVNTRPLRRRRSCRPGRGFRRRSRGQRYRRRPGIWPPCREIRGRVRSPV